MLVAAVTATAPLSGARPSVADSSLPTVSFRVVEPDGSPVVRPMVVVSVYGPSYSRVHVLAGGAAGQVVVPFPGDDPVAAAKIAAGEDVNLLIRVFDKTPGSADINAAYVGAAIGVDPWGTLRELSGVTGTTVMVEPGRTDFHVLTWHLPDAVPPPDPGGTTNNPPDYCYQQPEGNNYYCDGQDFPPNAQHVLVPVADNHGAGNDMVSKMTYHSTRVTTTGFAVQAGVTGFVDGDGQLAFEQENDVTLEWRARGPNDNVRALLDATYLRERSGMCVLVYDGAYQCQIETTYRPYEAIGTYDDGQWALNDHIDAAQDCWAPVSHAFEPATKSSVSLTFTFRLGQDENWATAWVGPNNPGIFYANTAITQQTHSGKSFIRRWETLEPPHYTHQYVYVSRGMVGAGNNVPNAACVAERIGEVHTDSENVDYELQPSKGPDVQRPSDPTEDEAKADHPVCGNMPDRCD